ncbi:unnamed protein product [Acanthoscelides obtectus]|uniref:FHA domain-containing protein n=1 Tax=Acanthoscelides obtectus TaxID=200917 RepID=A0A9P0PLA2_ACAOB|nr:unnamed protein product [Acanthoscelides obtectus]CAK1671501.1 Smad nuclear-interacting protein 1 [Acanthoscelides obtectus]
MILLSLAHDFVYTLRGYVWMNAFSKRKRVEEPQEKYAEKSYKEKYDNYSHSSKYKSKSRSPKDKKDRYSEKDDRRWNREEGRKYRDEGRRVRGDRERDRSDDRYEDRGKRDHKKDQSRDDRGSRGDDRRGRNHRERRRSNSFDHANAKWGKGEGEPNRSMKKENEEKDKPNFGLSGKLTEETNTYRGVVIKYSEPPEARKPRRRWRLYPFKGEKALQTLYIHRESAYLIGRDRKVVDLPVDHPSCSKQHAVLQFRLVPFTRDDGSSGKRVRPYLIDLESANGTFINNKKIEPKKYIELLERDVIKFGFSSREYVLLHENSKDEVLDDDVKQEEEEEEVKVKAEPV